MVMVWAVGRTPASVRTNAQGRGPSGHCSPHAGVFWLSGFIDVGLVVSEVIELDQRIGDGLPCGAVTPGGAGGEFVNRPVDGLVEVEVAFGDQVYDLVQCGVEIDLCVRGADLMDGEARVERVGVDQDQVQPLELLVSACGVAAAGEQSQPLVGVDPGLSSGRGLTSC